MHVSRGGNLHHAVLLLAYTLCQESCEFFMTCPGRSSPANIEQQQHQIQYDSIKDQWLSPFGPFTHPISPCNQKRNRRSPLTRPKALPRLRDGLLAHPRAAPAPAAPPPRRRRGGLRGIRAARGRAAAPPRGAPWGEAEGSGRRCGSVHRTSWGWVWWAEL